MKRNLKLYIVFLFLLSALTASNAQPKVDENNLITRLFGLNNLNITEAKDYFTSHNYTEVSTQSVQRGNYSLDLIKYKLKGQDFSYLLSTIADSVSGCGYITYSEVDCKQAQQLVKDMGFVPGEGFDPETGKAVYSKGNLRFIVQKNTADDNPFYVLMLCDLLKMARLAGMKK